MTLSNLIERYKDYPYNGEWQQVNYKVNFELDYTDSQIRFFSDEILTFKLDHKGNKPLIRFFLKTENMSTLIINLSYSDLDREMEKREERGKIFYTLETDEFKLDLGICDQSIS